MAFALELPESFPDIHIPEPQGVVQLASNHEWEQLDDVPVCVDKYGSVFANFGQLVWDCTPYVTDQGGSKACQQFDFRFLSDSPNLIIQTKLIVYGWLYHLGHRSGRRCKLSTLASRLNGPLKAVAKLLQSRGVDDWGTLSRPDVWATLEQDLADEKLSLGTLDGRFAALSSVARLNDWLPFSLVLPNKNYKALARKLAENEKTEPHQALAIPQSLADVLYGEAVRMVEQAWPHRIKLSQLERDLQANYETGRAIVDRKVASGQWNWLHDSNGQLDRRKYTQEISKAEPQKKSSIISNALDHTGLLPNQDADGLWFKEWQEQLRAACFICCGAFSGMRVSELFELHQDSFYARQIDGQLFPVVRAATHKLASGKKQEEWLCSPVVEQAIGLATALSASQREQMLLMAEQEGNPTLADQWRNKARCLWLSQKYRCNRPIVIARQQWKKRLSIYAKKVGTIVDEAALAECYRLNPQHHGAIEAKVKLGKPWPFNTHQFRRTFACFAVRNHLGHPIALKQQFKHLYLKMTEWYGNGAMEARLNDVQLDSDLLALLNDAGIEYTTATFHRFATEQEKIVGGASKAVVALLDNKPVIYSSWDYLYRLVKEKRLTLHGTLHSYCKNGYDCDMDGVINPAFCVECSGSLIDEKQADWWKSTHVRLTSFLQEQPNVSPGEYAHSITQIRAAEKVMEDFDMEFEAYEHSVKVLEL